MTPSNRFALVQFLECLERWVETDNPSRQTIVTVSNWITATLPLNPYAGSKRPFHEDPTMRYVELPFRSNEGRLVIVMYSIDVQTRTLTCRLVGEATVHEIVP